MEDFTIVLVMTGLGMGLVFMMIMLLWGLIALLAKGFSENPKALGDTIASTGSTIDRKRQAAAVAVAAALAREGISGPHEFPLPPTALVSAWQAVMRSEMLKKRGHNR